MLVILASNQGSNLEHNVRGTRDAKQGVVSGEVFLRDWLVVADQPGAVADLCAGANDG